MRFSLFLPEKIGDYYIIPTRVLSFYIEKNIIYATQLYAYRNIYSIEKVFTRSITLTEDDHNKNISLHVKMSLAIKEIAQSASYDRIVTTLTGQSVLLRQLVVPFIDVIRIKMILHYELAQYLPFSIHEAAYDFIVINQNKDINQSTILVAACKKTLIEEHISYFKAANLVVDSVSLSIFDVDSVFKKPSTESALYLVCGDEVTRIMLYSNGLLQQVRIIEYGIKSVDHERMWHEIAYTINAYKEQSLIAVDQIISLLNISLESSTVLTSYIDKFLHMPLTQISIHQFKKDFPFNVIDSSITGGLFMSFIVAYNFLEISSVDISEFMKVSINNKKINNNVIVAGILSLCTVIGFSGHTWIQIKALSMREQEGKLQAVAMLKKFVPGVKTNSLTDIIAQAKRELVKEEDIWFSFTGNKRSPLTCLYMLSTKIDRDSLGLVIKKLAFVKNIEIMTLEGKVKDFAAAEQFEDQLRHTGLFTFVPVFERIDIAVSLVLNKERGNA